MAWNCQKAPSVSFMRPRKVDPPIRSTGVPVNGFANDALIRIRESLTVGKRCRTCPASQFCAGGGVRPVQGVGLQRTQNRCAHSAGQELAPIHKVPFRRRASLQTIDSLPNYTDSLSIRKAVLSEGCGGSSNLVKMPGHHNWLNQTEIEMNSSKYREQCAGTPTGTFLSACSCRLFKSKGQILLSKPEQTWTKVYPKALADYASLPNEARWDIATPPQRRASDQPTLAETGTRPDLPECLCRSDRV